MGKKFSKTVKLAGAAAIAASAFAAVNPAQADAASAVENLVLKAEQNKVPLIRATSVDYDADAVTQPWTLYNKAKKDYAAAKAAVNKLSGKQKVQLSARLDTVKLYIDRTAAYIDAISSGKKLLKGTDEMEKYLEEGKMAEATAAYHKLSYEIKKQAIILYRVYGQSTRQAILDTYKAPAEDAKFQALYPVSIHIELDRYEAALEKEDFDQVAKHDKNVNEWLEYVDNEELYDLLSDRYREIIASYTDGLEDVAEIGFYEDAYYVTDLPGMTAYDMIGFFDSEGNELFIDGVENAFIIKDDKGYFTDLGSLAPAYAKDGLKETGPVKIQLFDRETNELILEETIEVKDGTQLYSLEEGKIVNAEGKDAAYTVTGQTYQFTPSEAMTLNGDIIGDEEGEELKLDQFPGITFKSSDVTKFVVNASGKITPVAAGKASLIVTWNEMEYKLPIEVKSASAVAEFGLASGKTKILLSGDTNFDSLIDAGYFTAKDQYGNEADLKSVNAQLFTSQESVFTASGENITVKGKDGDTASLIVKINGIVKSIPVALDKTAPVLEGAADQSAVNQAVTVSTKAADVASVSAAKNGTAITGYTLATPLTDEGVYEVTAIDFAGNKGVLKFEIDKTAPALAVSGIAGAPVITASEALYYKDSAGKLTAIKSAELDETQANALFTYTGAGKLKSATINADQHKWSFATEGTVTGDTVLYDDEELFDKAGNKLAGSVKATFNGSAWVLSTQ